MTIHKELREKRLVKTPQSIVATNIAATTQCDVTVLILTYNEERNIEQALRSVVGWAKEVVVVDSFSTDSTLVLATPEF